MTRKPKFLALWRLAERMDRADAPPRWFWRWLLGALDRMNEYRFEFLEADE